MLDTATEILIHIFLKQLDWINNVADIGNGVTIGYVIIGVTLIGVIISTILSRPISGNIGRFIPEREKDHDRSK